MIGYLDGKRFDYTCTTAATGRPTCRSRIVLTRLEVNGFKNLLNFAVDFGPFTCIAGPNGVGKSNIFDVIRFLSLLADHTILEAALQVRDTDPETSDLRDLFWIDGSRRSTSFRLAAEMIIERRVSDDFGRSAEASSSYLRYELEIDYEEPTGKESLERLLLRAETLNYITEGDAARRLRFPHSAKEFRRSVIHNTRRARRGYISTVSGDDQRMEILIHQERSSGRPQRAPAGTAPRTIVATSNTSTTPTILAVRREMQSWRLLALEPSAMRGADRLYEDAHITANGDHLPATLFRLQNRAAGMAQSSEEAEAQAEKVCARIANRLAQLVGVEHIRANLDQTRQLLTLEVQEQGGALLPARSLSDGTLRFLALCILAEDPEARGLICMEEPENGIHPEKMAAMVDLLRDLTVDVTQPVGPDNPLRQVIVASHSPAFVQLQNPDDLLFAEPARIKWDNRAGTTLRCRPLNGTWRAHGDDSGVGMATILAYLTKPRGAQIELSL